jgi:hypothetical protein
MRELLGSASHSAGEPMHLCCPLLEPFELVLPEDRYLDDLLDSTRSITQLRKFPFKLGDSPAQLRGILISCLGRHLGDPFAEGGKIDRGHLLGRRAAFAGLGSGGGVERCSRPHCDPLEKAQPTRRPHPSGTDRQRWQGAFHLGRLVLLGVEPDPIVDGCDVSGAGHS